MSLIKFSQHINIIKCNTENVAFGNTIIFKLALITVTGITIFIVSILIIYKVKNEHFVTPMFSHSQKAETVVTVTLEEYFTLKLTTVTTFLGIYDY